MTSHPISLDMARKELASQLCRLTGKPVSDLYEAIFAMQAENKDVALLYKADVFLLNKDDLCKSLDDIAAIFVAQFRSMENGL